MPDSLPIGGDYDETLQHPDISPEKWINTAPMQALLRSEGGESNQSAPAASEVATPSADAKTSPPPTVEEKMGNVSYSWCLVYSESLPQSSVVRDTV